MSQFIVTLDHEFYEVINAFPILRKSLDIDVSSVIEGQTIREYLQKSVVCEEEIKTFIRKINSEISQYLRDPDEFERKLEKKLKSNLDENEEVASEFDVLNIERI